MFKDNTYRPLADKMRPTEFAHYFGQEHIFASDKPLRQALEQSALHSMVFWGPPGSGKTSLAKLIAAHSNAKFLALSAVLGGVKEIRELVAMAKQNQHRAVILFVDEVHRFNKAQQDAFLPHIEDGSFFFIGATTENPSFALNNALLSRVRTYILKDLDQRALGKVIERALNSPQGIDKTISDAAKKMLTQAADGDARRCLNYLELAADICQQQQITRSDIEQVTADSLRRFDHDDIFYEQISALHKSVRGSNPDAALYWLLRMLDGGCDPAYIARRLVRMAVEDIGNADPRALNLALDAWQAYERLGKEEGELALAQCAIYLAVAAKSNACYQAYKKVRQQIKQSPSYNVPIHLRNAPTKLMQQQGYGASYSYCHDQPHAFSIGQTYFPSELGEREYYHPVERGLEIKIGNKINHLRSLNKQS